MENTITAKDVREALSHLPDDAPVKLTVVHHGHEPDVKYALFNIAYVKTPEETALVVVVSSDDLTPAELYGEEEKPKKGDRYDLTPTPGSADAVKFCGMNVMDQAEEIQRRRREVGQSLKQIADELASGDHERLRFRLFLLRLEADEKEQVRRGTLTFVRAMKIIKDRCG